MTLRFAVPADGAKPESLVLLLTRRSGEPQRFPFILSDIPLANIVPADRSVKVPAGVPQ